MLESITLVLDNSRFYETKQTERYALLQPRALEKMWQFGRESDKRYAASLLIEDIQGDFKHFLDAPKPDKFKKFKETHADWQEPSVQMMSILKTR